MDFFAQTSVKTTKGDTGVEWGFSPGLGYHLESKIADVLASRLVSQKAHLVNLYKPPTDTRTVTYVDNCINSAGYAKKVTHSLFNVPIKQLHDIDQFISSTLLKLDPRAFSSLLRTGGAVGSRSKKAPVVQLSPFQLFIVLDSMLNMIHRSDLGEHALLIVNQLRTVLGLGAMSMGHINTIIDLFTRKVVSVSVRRRMGKTVAVHYDLATSLCLFPAAGLKALYTVHKAKAATDCYTAVDNAVPVLIGLFNQTQYDNFHKRADERDGIIDTSDFYYEAYRGRRETPFSVNICFRQKNLKGNRNGGSCVSKNTLTCKAYTQRNVNIHLHILFFP